MSHTPEPWIFDEENTGRSFSPGFGLVSETGSIGVFIERQKPKGDGWGEVDCTERAIANSQRIIQCVNALAGVSDPTAFVAQAREMREAIREAKDVLLQVSEARIFCAESMDIDSYLTDGVCTALTKLQPFLKL